MSGAVAAIARAAACLALVALGIAQTTGVLSSENTAYKAGDMVLAIQLYREFLADHADAAEIRTHLGAALDDRAVIYLLGMALLKESRMVEAQGMLDKILREGLSHA